MIACSVVHSQIQTEFRDILTCCMCGPNSQSQTGPIVHKEVKWFQNPGCPVGFHGILYTVLLTLLYVLPRLLLNKMSTNCYTIRENKFLIEHEMPGTQEHFIPSCFLFFLIIFSLHKPKMIITYWSGM